MRGAAAIVALALCGVSVQGGDVLGYLEDWVDVKWWDNNIPGHCLMGCFEAQPYLNHTEPYSVLNYGFTFLTETPQPKQVHCSNVPNTTKGVAMDFTTIDKATMRSAISAVLLGLACAASGATVSEKVLQTSNLVAFWDFQETNANGNFVARSNLNGAVETGLYPVWLRRGGGGTGYTPATWDTQHSVIKANAGGPFGQGLNVDQQRLYANVERASFADTPLDISGRSPFTLAAWVKFPVNSHKHHIAGIWDEGSWNKYSGQRQYALFRTGRYGDRLFGHISATGASSYPQSNASGSQYARMRALNGATLDEGEWRMLAMTYNGDEAQSSQDGVSTVNSYKEGEEWVEESVYPRPDHYTALTNPKAFDWGVYHPRRFVVKFKGYKVAETGVYEHFARVDLKAAQRTIAYGVKAVSPNADAGGVYELKYRFERNGQAVAHGAGSFSVTNSAGQAVLPQALQVEDGDTVVLELLRDVPEGVWSVGGEITREIGAGAPFTFGRVLGGGTQMTLGGVAMYNRALSAAELANLVSGTAPAPTTAVPETAEPATAPCTDLTFANGGVWNDRDGPKYNCAWYERNNKCATDGAHYRKEHIAQEACCACPNGGSR